MNNNNFLKRLTTSTFLSQLGTSKKIAFIALFAALSVVTNLLLEIRIFDIQFSLTIFISCFIGIMVGPVWGFASCLVGDLVGYMFNSWGQLYMPWVGISTGMFAFFAGLIFMNRSENVGLLFVKVLIFSAVSFLVCTVFINSLGFYIYNKNAGFSTAVLNYVSERFGGEKVSFIFYLFYRLIFKGQIFNSIANYALLFIALPVLKRIKIFENFI